ncbi:DivIVA domain-containing protein [Glycomyces tenuis]|uniref:DivIVA domain-containing protein n=2 Tax=Glycomyces tenuis TaxID=58116 RepID=UPI00040DB639|nr:DivIVA domain-containing protein [Glycomyces tenuis]
MASHGDRFRRRALSRGYKVDEVDAFLDRVEATLAGEPVGSPVTADEVDDVVFRVRFGGYDEWQVDVYLDRVARQLAELEERGVLGTAPAPDYGKPETAAAAAVPPAQPGPGQRRNPDPAPTQAIPAREMMAAREVAPPPPVREPAARSARAAAPPPDNEGFGDLRGDDDEGFGFLAGPPGDDYDDPFAAPRGGGGGREQAMPPPGDFGPPRGPEPAPPRGPEPAAPRGGEYGQPRRDPVPPPQRGPAPMHDGPQAGSSPHGATEQLPIQSDPRRGGFQPEGPSAGGFGPPMGDDTQVQPAMGAMPPGRRPGRDPAPGFGAAYDDELEDTGRRPAMPHGQSSQPPMPPSQPGAPTGPIPQAGAPRQSRAQDPRSQGVPPAPPTAPIPQQSEPYGSRGRTYGGGYPPEPPVQQHDGFAPEGPGPEDTGFGRRGAAPSPPPAAPGGGFAPPAPMPGSPPAGGHGPSDNGAYGQGAPPPQSRGPVSPPDFARRNPYEGRGSFEAPGRHGREEMTTEMRATDSPFTPDDVQRLEQLRRAFQPRRFGSGYDPGQVDQMFDAVSAAMTGRNPMPLSDRELDTSQFSLVQGGYFEAEVDSALREVRELFARRGMMH